MVSPGPNTQSYDFKHLIEDTYKRRLNKTVCEDKRSVVGILRERFSKFFYVLHLSGMMKMYSDMNYEGLTIFAPVDSEFEISDLELIRMDAIEAIDIIKRHTIETIVPYNLLFNSNSYFLNTKHESKKILVDADPREIILLNGRSCIVEGNIIAGNGIIHAIDKIIR
jgi:uncharacterized surface protein with fasciclin (FAS1) repeats